jgi:hypothetical protein
MINLIFLLVTIHLFSLNLLGAAAAAAAAAEGHNPYRYPVSKALIQASDNPTVPDSVFADGSVQVAAAPAAASAVIATQENLKHEISGTFGGPEAELFKGKKVVILPGVKITASLAGAELVRIAKGMTVNEQIAPYLKGAVVYLCPGSEVTASLAGAKRVHIGNAKNVDEQTAKYLLGTKIHIFSFNQLFEGSPPLKDLLAYKSDVYIGGIKPFAKRIRKEDLAGLVRQVY